MGSIFRHSRNGWGGVCQIIRDFFVHVAPVFAVSWVDWWIGPEPRWRRIGPGLPNWRRRCWNLLGCWLSRFHQLRDQVTAIIMLRERLGLVWHPVVGVVAVEVAIWGNRSGDPESLEPVGIA